MRKITLTLMLIAIIVFAFAQDEIVVGWTFPGNGVVADTANELNLDREIGTFGGTSQIEFKNGYETKAAQASGWNDGMDIKGWTIGFSSLGYAGLTISSRQQSGGNDPGPKNFKIQFSIDEGISWIDVDDGEIEVENDWETSFVDQIPLPELCNNLEFLMIRWIMTSNEASGGAGTVLENGKSKIDDVFIKGSKLNGIEHNRRDQFVIGPNPVRHQLNIQCEEGFAKVEITDQTGKILIVNEVQTTFSELRLLNLKAGIYFLRIFDSNGIVITSRKIIKTQ